MNRPFWIIILSLVIGGAAGILTSAITNNHLSEYSLRLVELTEPLRLSQERPRNFPKNFEAALAEVKTKAQPGVVEFYLKKTGQSSFDAVGKPVMFGLVLTSDGWLVTHPSVGQTISSTHIVVQNNIYQAEQIISDSVSGAVFVKIDARNLPVVAFGEGFDATLGEQVFLLPGCESVLSTRITQITHGDRLQQESDQAIRRLQLDYHSTSKLSGAPVVNLAGEFIGLAVVNPQDEVVILPNNIFLPSFSTLLRQNKIVRPSLGVKYVDLSRAIGLDSGIHRDHDYGALLWDNFYDPVPYGSAAALAGLKANDIILSIDGQPLNNQRTLAERLLEYQPNDIVTLQVDRGGEILNVIVTLQTQR